MTPEGIIVVNDNPKFITGFGDFFEIIKKGSTRLRDKLRVNPNSRSHTILSLEYIQVNFDGSKKTSKL